MHSDFGKRLFAGQGKWTPTEPQTTESYTTVRDTETTTKDNGHGEMDPTTERKSTISNTTVEDYETTSVLAQTTVDISATTASIETTTSYSGYIADPMQCDRFFNCVVGNAIPLYCPAGLEYEPVSKQCVPISENGCFAAQGKWTPTEPQTTDSGTSEAITINNNDNVNATTTNAANEITDKETTIDDYKTTPEGEIDEVATASTIRSEDDIPKTTQQDKVPTTDADSQKTTILVTGTTNSVTTESNNNQNPTSRPTPEINLTTEQNDNEITATTIRSEDDIPKTTQQDEVPTTDADSQKTTILVTGSTNFATTESNNNQNPTNRPTTVIDISTEQNDNDSPSDQPKTTTQADFTTEPNENDNKEESTRDPPTTVNIDTSTGIQTTLSDEINTEITTEAASQTTAGVANDPSANICPPGFSGFIPDPAACDSFYQCIVGHPIRLFCGSGSEFDPGSLQCVPISPHGCYASKGMFTTTVKGSPTTDAYTATPDDKPTTIESDVTDGKETTKYLTSTTKTKEDDNDVGNTETIEFVGTTTNNPETTVSVETTTRSLCPPNCLAILRTRSDVKDSICAPVAWLYHCTAVLGSNSTRSLNNV